MSMFLAMLCDGLCLCIQYVFVVVGICLLVVAVNLHRLLPYLTGLLLLVIFTAAFLWYCFCSILVL